MEGTGVVPVMDMNTNHNYDGFGGGWVWIILLFALFGFGGNGWGNRQGFDGLTTFANGTLTREQVVAGFNAQDIKDDIRDMNSNMVNGLYVNNDSAWQRFNNLQNVVAGGFANTNMNLNNGFARTCEGLMENKFTTQRASCEQLRNIDSVKAEAYQNTCAITNAIREDGEKTRALITQNTIQDLRDKLAERDRDLQTANFEISQKAQNDDLVSALRPFPIPAYQTVSPYTGASGVCNCMA